MKKLLKQIKKNIHEKIKLLLLKVEVEKWFDIQKND